MSNSLKISAIVAIDEQGAIGKDNKIPWHLPADLRHFKDITMGHPIVMGRKTYESIGRALPGRMNIVVSRDQNYRLPDAQTVTSLDDAIALGQSSKEIFIIGGEEIFNLAMPQLTWLYLTKVHTDSSGDRFFRFDEAQWREVSRQSHKADDNNPYDYDFILLKRV